MKLSACQRKILCALGILTLSFSAFAQQPNSISRKILWVSAPADGGSNDNGSALPAVSGNGRYAVFESLASNLVPDDNNGIIDIFVRNLTTNVTERVSVASDGTPGNGDSDFGATSADGRIVAFTSFASNLVPDDANGSPDIFVHDRLTGLTTLVSVASDGTQAFIGTFSLPALSASGRYVAFGSSSSNLVPDDTNGQSDIFVHDRLTGATSRVNVGTGGIQSNDSSEDVDISADGRYVVFKSRATNLVGGDTNGWDDIFLVDLKTGVTTRINLSSNGEQANGQTYDNPRISANGRRVSFYSAATNLIDNDTNGALTDTFVRDLDTDTTFVASVASDGSQGQDGFVGFSGAESMLSADGNLIVFTSFASDMVANDTNGASDVFLRDFTTGITQRVSVSSAGNQASGQSDTPDVSNSGRIIVFQSGATELIPGPRDDNIWSDIYASVKR